MGVAMRSTRFFLLSILLLLGTRGSAQPVVSDAQVVPAKIYAGYLVVVQGSIGPLKKRNLVIDTGARPSIISQEIADKLHLALKSEFLRVVDHVIPSKGTIVPSVELGPIRATGLHMSVQDLGSISQTYGVRVDALIGFDVLIGSSFRIDYRDKKVIFGPIDSLPNSAPLRWTDTLPVVDLKVNDQPAHLLVDTATTMVLLFAQRLPWTAAYSSVGRGYTNLGGSFQLRQISPQNLELAGSDLGTNEIYLSTAQNLSAEHFDGFLATGALPLRQIGFDVDHQRLGWEPANSKADDVRIRIAKAPRRPPAAAPTTSALRSDHYFQVMGQCMNGALGPTDCLALSGIRMPAAK
jgi:hypothetical protein